MNAVMPMVMAVKRYQYNISYCVGCPSAASFICKFLQAERLSTVVEVGCGRQSLGLFCLSLNPDIISWEFTDKFVTSSGVVGGILSPATHEIANKDAAEASRSSKAQVLVISWPRKNDSMAADALVAFSELCIYESYKDITVHESQMYKY